MASQAPTIFGAAEQARSENDGGPFIGARALFTEPGWDAVFVDTIAQNWNKQFPFQLLTLRRRKGSTGYSTADIEDSFTLPIPPEAMSMTTEFAVSTAVTLGGVMEEHNGAPLRTIHLSGTTGVLPLRGAVERGPDLRSPAATIFAGTVQTAR